MYWAFGREGKPLPYRVCVSSRVAIAVAVGVRTDRRGRRSLRLDRFRHPRGIGGEEDEQAATLVAGTARRHPRGLRNKKDEQVPNLAAGTARRHPRGLRNKKDEQAPILAAGTARRHPRGIGGEEDEQAATLAAGTARRSFLYFTTKGLSLQVFFKNPLQLGDFCVIIPSVR